MRASKVDTCRGGLMRRLGRRFIKDRSGATAVEFGFILLPFFALLFSIFENAYLLMVDNGLQQAVTSASRQVLLGNAQSSTPTTGQAFRDKYMCDPAIRILPTYIDCNKLVVNMQALPPGQNFGGMNPGVDFYSGGGVAPKYCTGGPGYIVMLNVMYPMPSYFPIFSGNWSTNGGVSSTGLTMYNGTLSHITLGTAVFQNEPFANWSGAQSGC